MNRINRIGERTWIAIGVIMIVAIVMQMLF